MDANKRLKLLEIGYEIKPACGMCVHANFRDEDFGTCNKVTYQHFKHVGSPRPLSILRYGSCPQYQPALSYETYIHGFKEFLK
jgi:hypothetical protein